MSKSSRRLRSPQRWKKQRRSLRRSMRTSRRGWVRALIQRVIPSIPRIHIRLRLPKKTWRVVGVASVFLFIIGTISAIGFVAWATRNLPNPGSVIKRNVPLATKIYDRTGEHVLYAIHGKEKRTALKSLDDIPEYVKWAVISIEDKDFYTHQGFDLRGIARAILKDILFRGKAQGGSTITQQFIKNAVLTSEKTFTRKIKELILSYEIEKRFTKDEILLMYLNEIPYGSVTYGIEEAAQAFFGTSARDLTIAEAAVLAAIPKATTYYSPFGNNRDALINRQRLIIDLMEKYGHITKEEAEEARNEKLAFTSGDESILAPHFIFYVRELLSQRYGEHAVETGGLKVITTLDLEKQKAAEAAINQYSDEFAKKYNASNAALVALDPRTGEILAMVGSKDYFDDSIDGQVNVVLRPRQPGSSFKPIVYAAALLKGYTADTVLYDVETVFKTETKDYAPKNYTLKEYGPVTLRKALGGSLNIPAVKMIYLTGIDRVLELAAKFGYTTLTDRSRFGLSLVLGGGEVKLLEHVAAYGIFARDGMRVPTNAILRIEDAHGKVLEEWRPPTAERVLDADVARTINAMLSDNNARTFIFGEQNSLTLGDRPVAAKTGTTNDIHDVWTVGYTPSLVAGVWVGNNNNKEMKAGASSASIAAPIWNMFMRTTLKGMPVESFTVPAPIDASLPPMLRGIAAPENIVRIDRASRKRATDRTPETFIEEVAYSEPHTILHYINKDDPRGAPPEHPETDIQYSTWEEAVQRWAKEQELITDPPPEEKDDLHIPQNEPTLFVHAPSAQTIINTDILTVNTTASAPRGIGRVEIWMDDRLLTTLFSSPYTTDIFLPVTIENGFHHLTIKAFDDIDNKKEESFEINVLR